MANSTAYSHKAEAFSFALVLWELAAHRKPFTDTLPEHLPRALANGHRPPIQKKWPEELQSVLAGCWRGEPAERPELRDVLPVLMRLRDELLEAEKKRGRPRGAVPASECAC